MKGEERDKVVGEGFLGPQDCLEISTTEMNLTSCSLSWYGEHKVMNSGDISQHILVKQLSE